MTADGWVWASFGLLLVLLGARAWVVETGHATLGRTPVKVKVLTGACGVAVALVVGLVAANGGARLVNLVLHPEVAQALEDAEKAADASTAPATRAPADGSAPGARVGSGHGAAVRACVGPAGPAGRGALTRPVRGPSGRRRRTSSRGTPRCRLRRPRGPAPTA